MTKMFCMNARVGLVGWRFWLGSAGRRGIVVVVAEIVVQVCPCEDSRVRNGGGHRNGHLDSNS